MQTTIKYIKTETIEEEIIPARIALGITTVIITMPDGSSRTASVLPGQQNYAIIENGKLRFKHELKF
jgi:hypothetical protein